MRACQRERFFGSDGTWRGAMLTPIASIYNTLPDDMTLTGGWWSSKIWQDLLICVTPQGSAILDALCALEATTQVVFVGLAGALSTYAVGDVVEPSTTTIDGVTFPSCRDERSPFPNAAAATVRCLNESLERQAELTVRAQVVDMESAWVCAEAQRHGREARIVLVVSDELHGRTFLESDLTDIRAPMSRAANWAVEQLLEVP
jgi:purine-nucleoside phosphorylase